VELFLRRARAAVRHEKTRRQTTGGYESAIKNNQRKFRHDFRRQLRNCVKRSCTHRHRRCTINLSTDTALSSSTGADVCGLPHRPDGRLLRRALSSSAGGHVTDIPRTRRGWRLFFHAVTLRRVPSMAASMKHLRSPAFRRIIISPTRENMKPDRTVFAQRHRGFGKSRTHVEGCAVAIARHPRR